MIPQWLDFRSRSTASSSRQISEVVLPRKMSACDAEADSSRVAAGGVYGHLRLFGAPGWTRTSTQRTSTLEGKALSDFITSEYGVALLLDEHINRPGHVPGTFVGALNTFRAETGKGDPKAAPPQHDQAPRLARPQATSARGVCASLRRVAGAERA